MPIWVLIAAIVVNLSLALVILSRVRSATSTAYFAISSLFIVGWAAGTLLMLYGETVGSTYLGLLLFLFAPMATTLYMVLFARHFADIDYPRRYIGAGIFTAFMVTIAVFVVKQLFETSGILTINTGATNSIDFGHSWYWVYGSYFSIMFIIAYIYMLVGVARARGRARVRQKIVLSGIFLTSFLALGSNVLLPAFGVSDYVWLGPAWTIFYVIATSYAMIKHGLFDLRMALVLTFTYGLSLAVLGGIYYGVAFAISSIFIQQNLSLELNALNVSLALLIAFIFQPIRKFFDRLTSRIFYQHTYNVDDFFAELNGVLSSTTELRTLLRRAAAKIVVAMKATRATFVIYSGEHRVIQVGEGKPINLPLPDARQLEMLLNSRGGEAVVLSYLDHTASDLRRLMISHGIAVVLPLMRQEKVVGFFLLGEHRKNGYVSRDIRVLRAISDEIVIAIQNALSLQKLRDLNAHLEQRIDNATKELRRSNAQLQRLDEAKDEFISMASHQLRTPLTSIKGYISMLAEGDAGKVTKEQKHLLDEAFMSSERMVRLIGDFLNVSRLQTGKFLVEKAPADLSQIVEEEISSLHPNAAARDLKFTYKRPKNIPRLNLDDSKIRQVIMNFADNAMYYSKEKSTIKIELKLVGDWVEFTVKDKGIGVPESEKSRLFTKFFRAANARKQRPDGTGVGLFLAKKVVDAHSGQIIFESQEGKGSTFGFRLPIAKLRVTSDTK